VRDSVNPFDLFSKSAINKAKAEEKFKPQKDFPVHNTVVEQKPVEFKTEEKVETEISTETKINDNIEIIEKVENTEVISTETTQEIPKPLIDDEPMLIKKEDVFIKYIGEAFDTYIIAEKNNKEILFIDKHAAHERMIYEKLKSEKVASFSQILLQPITVTLGKKEYDAAINNIDMFKDCAFEIEDFGNSTVIVRSAPQYLDAADINDCVVEMADYISMGKNDIMAEKMDWFYHNVACRSAIKAGNKSTPQELIELVKKLEENPQIRYCPHGRPVCIVMTKSEIEKQFGRV
jgi:DNA mismatch repair protein MutL